MARRNIISVFPDAFLQDIVEDGWLAHQLPLHVQGTEAVLDLQHPAALVHLAANGDDVLHETFPHEVNALQFPCDLAAGEEHLHIGCCGGLGQ
jgi:hypothetical protein